MKHGVLLDGRSTLGLRARLLASTDSVQVLPVERSSRSMASLWRASSQLAGAYRLTLLVFFPFLIINANCEEALAFFFKKKLKEAL